MSRDFGDTLMDTIDSTLQTCKAENDNDKLLFSALAEVSLVLYGRLGKNVINFSISVTPTQAMALRMFYTDFICEPTSYIGNGLHRIANEVHKNLNI